MEFVLQQHWALIAAGGFIVGVLVGATGVGGGAVTTPMLISGFGVPPAVAVGTDLLFAAITKASGAWRHHALGNVDWPILRWLATGSVSAAALTLLWLHYVSADLAVLGMWIRQALAVALVVSAIAIPLFPPLLRWRQHSPGAAEKVRKVPTVLFGVLLGVTVTLTSVGAGAIGVAVLSALYPALMARRIVGTDIVHAIPLAFVSGMGHLGMGNVDFAILGALLVGSVPGIILGSRLTGVVPDWLLRIVLSAVLLYAAYLVVDPAVIAWITAFLS